jgi:hypothetical protein
LICILNEGGYGAESHKFRASGGNPNHAIHGRGDLAAIARGFGLNGTKVTEMGRFERLFGEHQQRDGATLWDVNIDDRSAYGRPRGQPSNIRGGSRMQESCTYGSVRTDPVAAVPPSPLRGSARDARHVLLAGAMSLRPPVSERDDIGSRVQRRRSPPAPATASAEAGGRAFALGLRFVAVNSAGLASGADEMPHDLVGAELCSHEGGNRAR